MLGVVCVAQLMITLDITIVNIALPAAQRDLGFSDAQRQWVITAYALAFGSLLLISGRVADRIGRRTVLIVGLVVFGAGSALDGAPVCPPRSTPAPNPTPAPPPDNPINLATKPPSADRCAARPRR